MTGKNPPGRLFPVADEPSGRITSLTHCPSLSVSLRPLDIEFMKRLSHSVNIIPVLAKADTMTIEERQEFKQRVSFTSDLHHQLVQRSAHTAHFRYNGISVYMSVQC